MKKILNYFGITLFVAVVGVYVYSSLMDPLLFASKKALAQSYMFDDCTGTCYEGYPCHSWKISYDVDCLGDITNYESVHYDSEGNVVAQSSSETDNIWSGMNAAEIGCDTIDCT